MLISKKFIKKAILEIEDVKEMVYSGLRNGEEYFDCFVMEEKFSNEAKKASDKFIALCDAGSNPMDALSVAF